MGYWTNNYPRRDRQDIAEREQLYRYRRSYYAFEAGIKVLQVIIAFRYGLLAFVLANLVEVLAYCQGLYRGEDIANG